MISIKRTIFSLAPFFSAFSEEFCTIENAIVSVYAVRSDTGKVVIDQNSDLSLVPSSTIKIVTTAAALQILGSESRFETHLEYDGSIEKGTLHGNLYIRGNGDPCLGSDRIAGSLSWKKQLAVWADAVQKLGIRKIEGKVIGDASRWEKALAVPSWSWEDLGNYYGAGASALTFHENMYTLKFRPGHAVGDPTAILQIDPPVPSLTLQNEVKTGPEGSGDQACIYGSEFSSHQFVRGTVPAAVNEFSIKGAIPDPASACADFLALELEKGGISIEQSERPSQKNRQIFHTTSSPTIGEIVHWTNRVSHNLYAEHLLKQMGWAVFGEGTTASGIKAIMNHWRSQGIDLRGFNMADGSGLSRKNMVTAKQFVQILLKMKPLPTFPLFFESLPQPENGVRAKSGSMSFLRGYAGYTGNIVFAIMVNQCTDRELMNKKIKEALLAIKNLDSQK